MFLPALYVALAAAPGVDSVPVRWRGSGGDSVIYKTRDEIRVRVSRAPRPPVLDGRLDDEAWKSARPMNRFVQYEPVDSVLPPGASVGWAAYDDRFLYVAFRAYAPRADIRATVHPRERGGELDDKVAVAVDTYNDNRRAYVFRVSPIGLQFDGVKSEGQNTDDTPDFVWYSAARIDDEGWVAEVAIPFASLRLPGGDSLDFGFDMVRYHGKAGTMSSWSPRRRGSACDICQQGTLVGLRGIRPGRTVDLLPYLSGGAAGARAFGSDSALVGGVYHATRPPGAWDMADPAGSVGADVRVALTPSATLNATLNPDFSQVESDDEQIRVNQRFALFFQERRPFFLESRDIFDPSRQGGTGGEGGATGQLVYTRAIVDPSLGARLTGKSGATQYGLLYARDGDPAWFHYDRHESGGVAAATGVPADALIARVRRDVLEDSWFGISLLGRNMGAWSGVLGTDVALRRGNVRVAAEAGWSGERALLDTAKSATFDGRTREGRYYRAAVQRSGRRFGWAMAASGLSPGFRNQLGRYSRVGIETFSGRLDFDQYPNGRVLQQVSQSLNVTRTNVYDGGFLDYNISPRLELLFRRRASLNFTLPIERQTMLGVPLQQFGGMAEFRLESWRWVQLGGFLYAGDRELFDPDDPRTTKGIFGNLRLTLRPAPQAALELRGQRSNHFERWGGGRVDDARIVRLRGTYQVSPRLGARLIGEYSNQYNTIVSSPLARRNVRFAGSALVTYELAPASFLFAGYNDLVQDFEGPTVVRPGLRRTGNQFFLKVSYLLRR